MRSRGSVAGTIGERVVFKDPAQAINLGLTPVLYKDQEMNVDFCVDVMVITMTRTRVEVLWQDGTREWVPSTSIIPHLNLDEYECWYVSLYLSDTTVLTLLIGPVIMYCGRTRTSER